MTSELTKIIVKVGNVSHLKFSHCKLYRAILASDLDRLQKAHSDCNIVIIEHISEDEQDAVREFAKQFNDIDSNHKVLFYIPDNDDITSGIADELDYNIFLTLDDLYKEIYSTYGINVSTYIADKAKYNSLSSESDIQGLDYASFEDIMGDKIEDSDTSTDSVVLEATAELDNTMVDDTETMPIDTPTVETVEETVVEPVVEPVTEPVKPLVSNITLDKEPVVESVTRVTILDEPVEKKFDADTDVETQLRVELNDLKYSYNQAVNELKQYDKENEKLENIIRALTEEKNDILSRFNALTADVDIVEEPISLSEYNKIKDNLVDKENVISNLEKEIDKLKQSLSDNENLIKINSETILERESTIEKLNSELEDINSKIESGEFSKDIVANYEAKVAEIVKLKDNEVNYRLDLMVEISELLNKLIEVNNKVAELETSLVEANESIGEYKEQLKETKSAMESLTESNESELNRLNSEIEAANKRAELANNYADTEKADADKRIKELETNLNIVKEQLEYKENQYKSLIEQSKNSSNESITLANTNSSLDAMNKTLREKLGTLTKELESVKSSKADLQNTVQQYQGQINRLTNALNSVTKSGNVGVVSAGSIQKALYSARAQIITVFGSGSFGITTTAMSLASKLSTTSKVLYMDLDLVAPKADAWFSKNPICKDIVGLNSAYKMSALGVFYELGIDAFVKYSPSLLHQCERTKGGGIDYFSGAYYRVDASKIAEADYSSLLNFLGNMYSYIIIDLGRFGSSEVNDNLIKMLSDVAHYNVVVTTSDHFEIRNFRWRLNEVKINNNSIAWLINMCDKPTISEKTKQHIDPCKFGFMLHDQSLHGTRERFTRNKLNKDRLDLFANNVLFASRK